MKIVFMGTPDFAVGALQAIIEAGHHVAAVVTQPDKPKGRGKELQMTPVKACAVAHDIPVFQPVKIKDPEAVAVLRGYQADIFVVAAFGQILSEEILAMPKYGCINIHASLLPKYRGAGPIQWAIIDGEKKTGITIMQMEKGLDTGDMLFQTEVEVTSRETADTLHDKLAAAGARDAQKTKRRGVLLCKDADQIHGKDRLEHGGGEAGLSDSGADLLAGRIHHSTGKDPEDLGGGACG